MKTGGHIETGDIGGVTIAALSGDIDLVNGDEVAAELYQLALASADGLVLDLSDVRYVDSAGVTMLFALRQELEQSRVRFALSIPDSSPVRRLLKITNLDELVPTLPTNDDAVATLRALP